MQPTTNLHLVDTHCHLDFKAFDGEREQILANANRAGIQAVINPGVDAESSRKAIELASTFAQVYAAVGVHPNEAQSWNDETPALLENLSQSKNVVAIGEIGLDYIRDRTPRADQIQVFEKQLELGSKLKLPVILHNRDADQDLLTILKNWQQGNRAAGSPLADHPGVLHSFSASAETAFEAIDLNFYIGITGPVTFPNAKNLQALVRELPLDHLLIETDAPFLAPQPRRGKRNEPSFLYFTALKIAELQEKTIEEVAQKTTANARLLFQIGEKLLA